MGEMVKSRRRTMEFKRQAVKRMRGCRNIAALARELGVERKLLYKWERSLAESRERATDSELSREERTGKLLRDEITKLKSALVEKTLENDFFKSALLRVKQERQPGSGTGASASTTPSARGCKSKAD